MGSNISGPSSRELIGPINTQRVPVEAELLVRLRAHVQLPCRIGGQSARGTESGENFELSFA